MTAKYGVQEEGPMESGAGYTTVTNRTEMWPRLQPSHHSHHMGNLTNLSTIIAKSTFSKYGQDSE